MARRPLTGRDQKIIQGHRRDAFFARMRRTGGVPRMPTQGGAVVAGDDELAETQADDGQNPTNELNAAPEPENSAAAEHEAR